MILHDLWQVLPQPVREHARYGAGGRAKKGFWAWAVAGYMGIECDGQRAYSYGTRLRDNPALHAGLINQG
ncbi:hypothetical protein [Acetobacter sp. LMG 32666]|uniref:hypothetical protein n=1 Tax=Acetobacter sp. LMG 32666 TaxID=2959295 RepID=UPI0030C7AEBC